MQEIADQVGITLARVSQILSECVKDLDQQALAAKDDYRKFLLTETEAQARRLNARLAQIPPGDVATAMKVEEQLRKNAELRAKLTVADKIPVPPPGGGDAIPGLDVQKIIAEVDAWTPPLQIEQHAEPVSEGG
jgi:hypothetical protein